MHEAALLLELVHLRHELVGHGLAHADHIGHRRLHRLLLRRRQRVPGRLVGDDHAAMVQVLGQHVVRCALRRRRGDVVREGQVGRIDQAALQRREQLGQRHLHAVAAQRGPEHLGRRRRCDAHLHALDRIRRQAGLLADHVVPAHFAQAQQHQALGVIDLAQHRQRELVGDEILLGRAVPDVGHVQHRGLGHQAGGAGVGDAADLDAAAHHLLRGFLLAADEQAFGLDFALGAFADLLGRLVDERDQHRAGLGGRADLPGLLCQGGGAGTGQAQAGDGQRKQRFHQRLRKGDGWNRFKKGTEKRGHVGRIQPLKGWWQTECALPPSVQTIRPRVFPGPGAAHPITSCRTSRPRPSCRCSARPSPLAPCRRWPAPSRPGPGE